MSVLSESIEGRAKFLEMLARIETVPWEEFNALYWVSFDWDDSVFSRQELEVLYEVTDLFHFTGKVVDADERKDGLISYEEFQQRVLKDFLPMLTANKSESE